MKTPNGYVIYRGPSMIDGNPIVAIATGYGKTSKNQKTGAMVQLWILRDDMAPVAALKSNGDKSICGDCPLKGDGGKGRACYVQVFQGPSAVFKAYTNGSYHEHMPDNTGLLLRLGAYGDIAALPESVIRQFTKGSAGYTGYTHAWRDTSKKWLAQFCMASCESQSDKQQAKAKGYRAFTIIASVTQKTPKESICPASHEAGKKLSCAQCMVCSGNRNGIKQDIAIVGHGGVVVKKHIDLVIQ